MNAKKVYIVCRDKSHGYGAEFQIVAVTLTKEKAKTVLERLQNNLEYGGKSEDYFIDEYDIIY